MNEQDRKTVEDAKVHGGTMGTKGRDLLELIGRLDKQLAGVKEAGEAVLGWCEVYETEHKNISYEVTIAGRRLAQALKEIE